jgi:hypothetical protein
MYRKNGGCGYDKNGCGFVPKTGDLISREYLLSLASAEGAYDYVSAEEITKAPTVPAIPIPDNATNGEILCSIFPDMHYTLSEKTPRVVTTIGVASSFDIDWWNSPYKRGEME